MSTQGAACGELVLAGSAWRDPSDVRAAVTAPRPGRLIAVQPPGADLPMDHPAAGKGQQNSAATAYVCVGPECSLPLTDATQLAEILT